MFSSYFFCSTFEVDCSSIVPESFPDKEEVGVACFSKGSEGRECFEEFFIFWNDAVYLCLLEHYFRDEDFIRVGCFSPREVISSMFFVESFDCSFEGWVVFFHTSVGSIAKLCFSVWVV